jgi:hypothetical protein
MHEAPSPERPGGRPPEATDDALDPHRAEERAAATAELAERLARRGIRLTGRETSEEVSDLLDAVELFESEVEAHGGDLMVDTLQSSRPDDPHFVLPQRHSGESVTDYQLRVEAATERLRAHPRRPDR